MNRKKLTRLISVVLLIVIIDGIRVNKNKIKTMLP
ncbi:histidine kinase, partial [Clostridium sporogenes]|nr:histidine kinase [Clostridium botulinum]NFQ18583.1 histidine kinase [Clostridium sporogenes]NFP56358.1 histidine kinase [Clostridium botulinum]NFQ22519.1 histidine kinase [Clostridium sporogenes]NFQ29673.1 histidine kinase [Clostridium sporogenes]